MFQIQNQGPSPVDGLYSRVSLVSKHNNKWLMILFSAQVLPTNKKLQCPPKMFEHRALFVNSFSPLSPLWRFSNELRTCYNSRDLFILLRMKATTSHIWQINNKSQKKDISLTSFHFDTSIFQKQASENYDIFRFTTCSERFGTSSSHSQLIAGNQGMNIVVYYSSFFPTLLLGWKGCFLHEMRQWSTEYDLMTNVNLLFQLHLAAFVCNIFIASLWIINIYFKRHWN